MRYDNGANKLSFMPYHSHIDVDIAIKALNRMIDDINAEKTVFYSIYTEKEKQEDPTKNNTGLFFYRGNPRAPFAIICPGGGFAYVLLHEGFSYALEINKRGITHLF